MNRGSMRPARPRSRKSRGFNEAPIHESGKSGRYPKLVRHHDLASMRPRFMNRGSPPETSQSTRATASFNEAPIHESGKFRAPGAIRPAVIASMRPRFMNRGSR